MAANLSSTLRSQSLRGFLTIARKALNTQVRNPTSANSPSAASNATRVTLVVGNESADLDSITSALVYAYFRSCYSALHKQDHVHVPVLNIPRADIKIRPELTKLLPYAGLEPDNLITTDDVFASDGSTGSQAELPGSAEVFLVDHNRPAGKFSSSRGYLCGCIDHHVEEHMVPNPPADDCPRIVTLDAGSCTSLVVQNIRPIWDSLSLAAQTSGASNSQSDAVAGAEDAATRTAWDAQIAKLALASVLIDTRNLQDQRKTRQVDREAAEYLEARIQLAPPAQGGGVFDRTTFFDEIQAAKGNLNDLSVADVLRKDYKEWTVGEFRLGIGSSVKPLRWLEKKAESERPEDKTPLVGPLTEYAHDRSLDIFAVMTASMHDDCEFHRELLLWTKPRRAMKFFDMWLEEAPKELTLTDHDGVHIPTEQGALIWAWWQNDVSKSRKQVAPLMRRILEEAIK